MPSFSNRSSRNNRRRQKAEARSQRNQQKVVPGPELDKAGQEFGSTELLERLVTLLDEHDPSGRLSAAGQNNQDQSLDIQSRFENLQNQFEALEISLTEKLNEIADSIKLAGNTSVQLHSGEEPDEQVDPNLWNSKKARLLEQYENDSSSEQQVPLSSVPESNRNSLESVIEVPVNQPIEPDTHSPDFERAESSAQNESSLIESNDLIRQTEVELSVERAKVAKLRKELEAEKLEIKQKLRYIERSAEYKAAVDEQDGNKTSKLLKRLSRWLPNQD